MTKYVSLTTDVQTRARPTQQPLLLKARIDFS